MKQVRVDQIKPAPAKKARQPCQFRQVRLSANTQDGRGDTLPPQPIGHRPAAQGRHLNIKPDSAGLAGGKAVRQFVHDSLRPARDQFCD